MKFLKKKITFVLIYLFITILISPLRSLHSIGLILSSIIGFSIFYYLTIILINKYKSELTASQILLYGILGVVLINLPFHILYFKETSVNLLEFSIHVMGIVLGFGFTRFSSKKTKIIYTIVCFVLFILLSYYGNQFLIDTLLK